MQETHTYTSSPLSLAPLRASKRRQGVGLQHRHQGSRHRGNIFALLILVLTQVLMHMVKAASCNLGALAIEVLQPNCDVYNSGTPRNAWESKFNIAYHAGDAPLLHHLPDEVLEFVEPLAIDAVHHAILHLRYSYYHHDVFNDICINSVNALHTP